MRRSMVAVGMLVLGLGVLTAASAADQAPYEINAVVSQTGPAAFIGQAASKTLGVLEDVINGQGGIKGQPIKFTIYDDGSNPATAVQLITKIAAQKAALIIGPGFVATCNGTMSIIVNSGPVDWCLAPGVYPPAGSYNFISGTTTDDTTLILMRYFLQRGWSRMAVLSTTDASGQAWDHGVQYALSHLENKDIQLVAHEHMAPTDISVTAQLARIKAADPQVIMMLVTGTPFGTVMRGVNEVGITTPIGAGNGNLNYAQLKQYKSFLPSVVYFPGNISLIPSTVGRGPVKDAQTIYFNAFKRVGILPDIAYNTAWDPVMISVTALRALGTNATPQQLRDYILNLHSWAGVNGIYDFRDGHQRGIGPGAIGVFRYDNATGEFTALTGPAGGPLRTASKP